MHIKLHISLAGTPLGKSKIKIEVPEGATVKQALENYTERYKAPFSTETMRGIVILVNNSHAKLDRELSDGDSLKLFRPHVGG